MRRVEPLERPEPANEVGQSLHSKPFAHFEEKPRNRLVLHSKHKLGSRIFAAAALAGFSWTYTPAYAG